VYTFPNTLYAFAYFSGHKLHLFRKQNQFLKGGSTLQAVQRIDSEIIFLLSLNMQHTEISEGELRRAAGNID
jgi:hypothetical protein